MELVETYMKAKKINCSPDFLALLYKEIQERKIKDVDYHLVKKKSV